MQPTLAAGAKSLKATEKGGGKKGGKKGKGGKSRPQFDEHPGATWEGSAEWPAESEGWNWNWKGDEWATGEQTATEGAPATGAGGGGRRPPPGRDRPRGAQTELDAATLSLHKLTLRNSADIRRMKHMLEDFWLLPLNTPAAKAGIDGGKQYGILVREKGKGHGMGPPHLTVALRFMHALHDLAKEAHANEGIENDTAWAEIIIREFLREAYNEVYGKIVGTETFLDFKVEEAYTGKKDEGLVMEEPIAGQAKVMMAFNSNPLLQVALTPIKEKITKEKLKELGAYQTTSLRMATGYLLHKFGGKKGDATGPKTQLERVVEDNMRKLRGRNRPFA